LAPKGSISLLCSTPDSKWILLSALALPVITKRYTESVCGTGLRTLLVGSMQ